MAMAKGGDMAAAKARGGDRARVGERAVALARDGVAVPAAAACPRSVARLVRSTCGRRARTFAGSGRRGKKAGPLTPAQEAREEKHQHYRNIVARGGQCPQAEQLSTDHQVEVPWPHSYSEMGNEFMKHWHQEASDRGFKLRLSAWRHRT